jgi:hypothetical protein
MQADPWTCLQMYYKKALQLRRSIPQQPADASTPANRTNPPANTHTPANTQAGPSLSPHPWPSSSSGGTGGASLRTPLLSRPLTPRDGGGGAASPARATPPGSGRNHRSSYSAAEAEVRTRSSPVMNYVNSSLSLEIAESMERAELETERSGMPVVVCLLQQYWTSIEQICIEQIKHRADACLASIN